jgi:hypothetical protein
MLLLALAGGVLAAWPATHWRPGRLGHQPNKELPCTSPRSRPRRSGRPSTAATRPATSLAGGPAGAGRMPDGRPRGRSAAVAEVMSRRRLRDYGPLQLSDRLGLARWQLQRALDDGLIPPPDVGGARWSAAVAQAALARVDELRATVGALPDLGAWRAAEVLGDRFGLPLDADVMVELARLDLIPEVGAYKHSPLYCGRALERFDDRAALERAVQRGRLHTADEAAAYLRVRRCDLDHLVRAGWLEPARWVRSRWQPRRSAPTVALYRTGDLDVLATHPAIDWAQVRSTPRGRPSPLARLTTRR